MREESHRVGVGASSVVLLVEDIGAPVTRATRVGSMRLYSLTRQPCARSKAVDMIGGKQHRCITDCLGRAGRAHCTARRAYHLLADSPSVTWWMVCACAEAAARTNTAKLRSIRSRLWQRLAVLSRRSGQNLRRQDVIFQQVSAKILIIPTVKNPEKIPLICYFFAERGNKQQRGSSDSRATTDSHCDTKGVAMR